jgi:hypothetical protein
MEAYFISNHSFLHDIPQTFALFIESYNKEFFQKHKINQQLVPASRNSFNK